MADSWRRWNEVVTEGEMREQILDSLPEQVRESVKAVTSPMDLGRIYRTAGPSEARAGPSRRCRPWQDRGDGGDSVAGRSVMSARSSGEVS
jgi:hypothetical protein